MTTSYDTDPNASTIAGACASSPLGEPDTEVATASKPPAPAQRSPISTSQPPPSG